MLNVIIQENSIIIMEKQQKNIVEIAFINIVLYPTENQRPEEYVRLLSSIMQDRYKVKSGKSERETLLRTVSTTVALIIMDIFVMQYSLGKTPRH